MYDNYFEHTCPSCDNDKGITEPAEPLLDANQEPYEHECPKCGMQWQHGQHDWWPDNKDLVESSIRECILDFGANPRAEMERRRIRAERAADLRDNPVQLAEHSPLPWAVHSRFPATIVPAEDADKPLGASADPVRNAEFARVILTVHPRNGDERTARANAMLIVAAANKYMEARDIPESLSQFCRRTNVQCCAFCDDLTCCDNTSQARRWLDSIANATVAIDGNEALLLGCPVDPDHNCDQMGCGSVNHHVLLRLSLEAHDE